MKNKKIYYLFLIFPVLIIMLSACGGPKVQQNHNAATAVVPYNPLVSAFTSGTISRYSDIRIVFSQDVEDGKLNSSDIAKHIKFKPSVKGEFGFEDEHTILFRPDGEFAPNTTYNVSIDLAGWFETSKELRNFNFAFTTLPVELHGTLEAFEVDDEGNRYKFVIISRDREANETVESLVALSESGNAEWEHSADSKRHDLIVSRIATGSKARKLDVNIVANKLGAETGTIVSANVPASGSFSVYDVKTVFHPQRYVEVAFTHRLDRQQNLKGLVFIEGNRSDNYTVIGNRVRLYPDSDRDGVINIYIDESVRNSEGKKLGESQMRQVSINSLVPAVRFIGKGVVIPQTDKLMIPFEAVYLRGVTVNVIKIFADNIGQFLQVNRLDQSAQMKRVGRLIAHKTIFFEDQGFDLTRWNTFALNLTDLITPEPEAIYRIEFTFDKELSMYDMCDEQLFTLTREQIAERDEEEMAYILDYSYSHNGGSYEDYYYYDDYDYYYDDYDYYYSSDPCSEWFYYNRTQSRNVLATNLGVVIKIGANNEAMAIVNNILTTKPEGGVTVELFDYQQQSIGKGVTDASGIAKINFKGNPFYAAASLGQQRTYVRVDDGSALSTSSFDVSGEVVQKGLKGYIYGERGVWRPGDTMHLTFMLNDRENSLPSGQPVILEVYNPQGRIFATQTNNNGPHGIYTFNVPIGSDSPTGLWKAIVKAGGLTFSKSLRVETVKPNRLKINLKVPETTVLANQTFTMPLNVEWLTGATARGLRYEITGSITSVTTKFDKFAGFVFDDPVKGAFTSDVSIAEGYLDNEGNDNVSAKINIWHSAPGMTRVNMLTTVYEESGEFSIDGRTITCSPFSRYVGLKRPEVGVYDQLNTNQKNTFEVALTDHKGNPLKGTLTAEVFKLSWYWWWSSDNGRLANYMSEQHRKPVETIKVNTGSNGRGKFDLFIGNNDWGVYYIRVSDDSGRHTTGIQQYFDWPNAWSMRRTDGGDAAMRLNFTTDKTTYAPGEDIGITIPSTAGSRAIVTVETGTRVLMTKDYECTDGETFISIKATEEMMPNAYIYIILLQEYEQTRNDVPIRLYGIAPITVTSESSKLKPVIDTKDELRPEEKYEIVVSETNGREMSYTLAIVDEGLLDLTAFATPNPWKAFNAREALGVRTWDIYNYVVGAYGGQIERMFSIGGGDEMLGKTKNTMNRFTPVVEFEGPFTLKKGGKNKHTFEMPNYNGRVRVMVVASDGQAYGSSEKSVLVRKPVMLLGTLPRVIGTNEEMSVPAAVFTTVKNVGAVKVTIECHGDMTVVGSQVQELHFTDATDKMVRFTVRTGNTVGTGRVKITATAANGEKSVYETDINIRSVRKPVTKVTDVVVQPGQKWSESVKLPGISGTNSMSIELSTIKPLDLSRHLSYLIGYPHGCIEQITSKGFPQLYLKNFVDLDEGQIQVTEGAVKEVISRMRNYQTAEGAFAYWPGGTSTYAWATVYATHFLLESERNGYLVPASLKNDALSNLRAVARGWKQVKNDYSRSEELIQAYRLFVLALSGQPETGAMNRMKEITTLLPMSKWMLAAAYAQAGHKDVAKSIIATAGNRTDENVNYGYDLTFGSSLRDKAICLMALCLTDDNNGASVLANDISKDLASETWYSTQTTAFALMAMSRYAEYFVLGENMAFDYKSGNVSGKISTDKSMWSKELTAQAAAGSRQVEITNNGKTTIFLRVITSGTPEQGKEEAYSNNVKVTAGFVDGDGRPIDVTQLSQGVNFSIRMTVSNTSPTTIRNLVLTSIVPAGWEIVNRRFVFEGAESDSSGAISYQDIRDDRVYTHINLLRPKSSMNVTIDLMSAYSGRFYMPPVYCEAMYDNLIQSNTKGFEVVVE